ncbi:MAG: O-antigen ligase family protein [Phycisphaerales bacterium]|nr:MAG: O-antigen ligase family protein [Phycisphaerales bacterium]
MVEPHEPGNVSPMQAVMICLVAATVAGGLLLLSAAESVELVDGAIEWRVDSPLRAVVQLLCLNYQLPTIHAGEIKNFILGIGAGLVVLTLAIAIIGRRRGEVDGSAVDDEQYPSSVHAEVAQSPVLRRGHVSPLMAAQLLAGLYLLWSFASIRWSAAPDVALGGSVLLTVCFVWTWAIGQGLGPRGAHVAARIFLALVTITALVALWYFYGRNPTLRAKFPFGNPNFLSACLMPGVLLAVALVCESVRRSWRTGSVRPVVVGLAGVIMLAVVLWAFYLAKSRGPTVALLIGLIAMVFFAVRGRAKLAPMLLAIVILVATWFYFATLKDAASPFGRSATIRFRTYVWGYALDMFAEEPFTGYGQGGFVLMGDARALGDVLHDPLVFGARIAHAHNEWLEVMADLGAVGIVLIVAALILTLRAGMLMLETPLSPGWRWTLIGLMAALVAFAVEELFGVGLRVSGAPTVFFTTLGLIWALAGPSPTGVVAYLSARGLRRVIAGAVGIAIGLAILVVVQKDFGAARRAYRADEALRSGDYEDAIRLARASKGRLNPQRKLENLVRLSEAYMMVASKLQERAVDREMRARESDLPDVQLLALAEQDRVSSDEHCREGSRALGELIKRSPGYFNHGQIEYELNLIQAANAAARNNREEHDQCIKNAAAAIGRELLRRPFEPSIALEYLSVAEDGLSLAENIDILARPLRHNRIASPQVDYLAHLAAGPEFEEQFADIVQRAYEAIKSSPPSGAEDELEETWAPEKLRLAATIHFRRGDYLAARLALEVAIEAYDALAQAAPLGEASCHSELADCRFFADPDNPAFAIDSAERALSTAPSSLLGRSLKRSVSHRMIEYYLSADRESDARRLLASFAPPGTTDEAIDIELGARYRGLCESLLSRRVAQVLRQPANELLPKLRRWVGRAMALKPGDALAQFIAADLAFHADDCEATVNNLRGALGSGLGIELARQFLQAAIERRPDCDGLRQVQDSLPDARRDGLPVGYEPAAPNDRKEAASATSETDLP